MYPKESRIWTRNEVELMAQAFDDCTLPESEWTHHAHLVVGAWNLINLEFYEGTLKFKLGVARYNESLGNSNTITRGYHETLTLFWTWVIKGFINSYPDKDPINQINRLLESPYGDKYLPFFFYTEDLLFSRKARVMWVEPDVRDLNVELIATEYPHSIWASSKL